MGGVCTLIDVYKCPGGRLPCNNPCYKVVPKGAKIDKKLCVLLEPGQKQDARFFKLKSYEITELTVKCSKAIAYGSPVKDIKLSGCV